MLIHSAMTEAPKKRTQRKSSSALQNCVARVANGPTGQAPECGPSAVPLLAKASDRPRPRASSLAPLVHVKLAPALPTVAYDTYWRFAAERQAIFFRRFAGAPAPWTDDPILQRYKFTNAYRASDRVSQYLIREVI